MRIDMCIDIKTFVEFANFPNKIMTILVLFLVICTMNINIMIFFIGMVL